MSYLLTFVTGGLAVFARPPACRVTALFYGLFKPVNSGGSLLAAFSGRRQQGRFADPVLLVKGVSVSKRQEKASAWRVVGA